MRWSVRRNEGGMESTAGMKSKEPVRAGRPSFIVAWPLCAQEKKELKKHASTMNDPSSWTTKVRKSLSASDLCS